MDQEYIFIWTLIGMYCKADIFFTYSLEHFSRGLENKYLA